jgi:hypothetical protein
VSARCPAGGIGIHLRGVPDERIDIDIDTTGVALLVRRAMQEHHTQWNDMNNPEATEE